MKVFLLALLALFEFALASGQAPAKLFELSPPVPYSKFGWSVSGCGDINRDGFGDFIIGAIYVPPSPGSYIQSGAAYVYSGRDGTLLYEKTGNPILPFGWFGYSVAGGGDINGDGQADFIVGGSADVSVFSGSTGNLIYHIVQGDSSSEPNNSVADLGDINGDGRADFIVGNPYDYGPPLYDGIATVYSGATGEPIYTKRGDSTYSFFGSAVAGGGDVDGDGVNDFLVGAQENWGEMRNAGHVYVYSGASGFLLYRVSGRTFNSQIGWAIRGIGDIDSDGKADFIVGAPYDSSMGSAYVYSGGNGGLLYKKHGRLPYKDFGYSVVGTGDFDGDSTNDFAVGERFSPFSTGGGEPGAAYIYSGRNGNLLYKLQGDSAEDRMGWSLGSADVNADGRGDLICGEPSACVMGQYPYSGEVAVLGISAPVAALCPKNMNVAIVRSDSGATVFYGATGGCTPPPGSFFPIGKTIVVCRGASDFCWFTVHVHEVGKP